MASDLAAGDGATWPPRRFWATSFATASGERRRSIPAAEVAGADALAEQVERRAS